MPIRSAPAAPSAAPAKAAKEGEKKEPEKKEAEKKKDEVSNLRVDVGRIDKVMDLTGEVVLARNRLLNLIATISNQYADDPAVSNVMETVSFLDLVTSDLQLSVMKMRMQALQKVFGKFPRIVRDLAVAIGKEVDLKIIGEETEVDRSVIEHISDPMVHLIRNSIDHGIESPEARRAKGKAERGTISISASQRGNQIVIEIADDGKGIDLDRVKRKAIERGLVSAEEAERMTEEAAIGLIFQAGFSTMDVATELSGRGVGMDVVKTSISKLSGFVECRTRKDEGTTFRISIPLTLAIIQALMVRTAGVQYAVPLSLIEEIVRVNPDEIAMAGGRRVFVLREKVLPFFELSELLGKGAPAGGSGPLLRRRRRRGNPFLPRRRQAARRGGSGHQAARGCGDGVVPHDGIHHHRRREGGPHHGPREHLQELDGNQQGLGNTKNPASRGGGHMSQHIGFKLGVEEYSVPILSVREIINVPEMTRMPSTPDYIEGVANLRGSVVPIVSTRKIVKTGGAESDPWGEQPGHRPHQREGGLRHPGGRHHGGHPHRRERHRPAREDHKRRRRPVRGGGASATGVSSWSSIRRSSSRAGRRPSRKGTWRSGKPARTGRSR